MSRAALFWLCTQVLMHTFLGVFIILLLCYTYDWVTAALSVPIPLNNKSYQDYIFNQLVTTFSQRSFEDMLIENFHFSKAVEWSWCNDHQNPLRIMLYYDSCYKSPHHCCGFVKFCNLNFFVL